MEFFVYSRKIFLYYPERRLGRGLFGVANCFGIKRKFAYFSKKQHVHFLGYTS
jgi:hypothetical protein